MSSLKVTVSYVCPMGRIRLTEREMSIMIDKSFFLCTYFDCCSIEPLLLEFLSELESDFGVLEGDGLDNELVTFLLDLHSWCGRLCQLASHQRHTCGRKNNNGFSK